MYGRTCNNFILPLKIFQYLELRFNRWTRCLASLVFVIEMVSTTRPCSKRHFLQSFYKTNKTSTFLFLLQILYMAVVLYAPALALNQGQKIASITTIKASSMTVLPLLFDWQKILIIPYTKILQYSACVNASHTSMFNKIIRFCLLKSMPGYCAVVIVIILFRKFQMESF